MFSSQKVIFVFKDICLLMVTYLPVCNFNFSNYEISKDKFLQVTALSATSYESFTKQRTLSDFFSFLIKLY